MTDWGIHLLDIVHWAWASRCRSRWWRSATSLFIEDNRETPDTLQVTYMYPGFHRHL